MEIIHQKILQNLQEIRKKINIQEFCKMHNISASKFSRFPSEKFIEELMLYDYIVQYYKFSDGIKEFINKPK